MKEKNHNFFLSYLQLILMEHKIMTHPHAEHPFTYWLW